MHRAKHRHELCPSKGQGSVPQGADVMEGVRVQWKVCVLLAAASPGCSAPPFQLERLQLRLLCREMALGFVGFETPVRKAERLFALPALVGTWESLLRLLGFGIAVRSVLARLLHRYHLQAT